MTGWSRTTATAFADSPRSWARTRAISENRLRLADAPGGDPPARVFAQGHPVPCLRADEGRGSQEAPPAGRPGRQRRAVARQAQAEDRRPPGTRRSTETKRVDRRSAAEALPAGRRSGAQRRPGHGPRRRGGHQPGRAPGRSRRSREDSLLEAKQGLADSLEEFFGVLRQKDVLDSIGDVDRANLAKYLMIAKLRLENAIAMVRSGEIS